MVVLATLSLLFEKALNSYLCDAENDIYGRGKGADCACQLTAHHLRQGEREGHSQHHCFCLNASNTCRERGTQLFTPSPTNT